MDADDSDLNVDVHELCVTHGPTDPDRLEPAKQFVRKHGQIAWTKVVGTSFAAPRVSAIVALAKGASLCTNARECRQLLEKAKKSSDSGRVIRIDLALLLQPSSPPRRCC